MMKNRPIISISELKKIFPKIVVQLLGGITAGFMFGIIFFLIGVYLGANYIDLPILGMGGYESLGVLGAFIGIALGTSLGIFFVGKLFWKGGSYLKTVTVSSISALLGLGLYQSTANFIELFFLLFLVNAIFSTLGFHLSLKA